MDFIRENLMKHAKILCGKNIEVFSVTAGGTYTYNCAFNGCRIAA
jgi:hypothetical protein